MNTMRYHLTSVRMDIIQKTANNRCWPGCSEKEILMHCCWECKLVQQLWEKKRRFLKKLKIEVLCNPTILSLFIYSDKTKILIIKDICTPMFTEMLFTIAKIWKQPKCPSIDRWTEKMWYTYTNTHTHMDTTHP